MKKALAIGIDRFKKGLLPYYIEELKNLALSVDIDIINVMTQDASLTTPAYRIGRGKVDEVSTFIHDNEVDFVIFNDELTNTQIRNLEEAFDRPVIDRTLLILEIFAKRARTKEAMLQVEIAQLRYLKPRLSAMRTSFAQQQGGIGQKGPGEKMLELDRRKIDRDIQKLKRQLDNIVKVRQTNRAKRQSGPIRNVAIVGYTNAGKSTLMNKMLEHSIQENGNTSPVHDRLFATLETSTRRVQFKDKKPFTLTDTIGFIAQLPHELVDSFKATLEEIREADLLLHVIDFSHPYYLDQIQTTQNVLEELGCDTIETLYIFNKMDIHNAILPHSYKPAIKVSLKENINIDILMDEIINILFRSDTVAVYAIPQTRGDLINLLNETAEILDTSYEKNNIVRIKARVGTIIKNQLRQYEV